ncbi:enhanced intracellular survival protein Eis [Paenibacillus sp. L3-i20]|uniref:GNAT family N-acetyltransferase n=1 Tax=Paenibacillus sp. L3-i20 TaxID=2905833 RepID=UPI001EDE9EAB|nr:sterol carrier protein domain-containing protein [Paenibacillus sp. L3-i20]GKU77017.1 hypothetical protein L3i20_v214140 [Paenibacillus sp. L3-i20]
MLVRTDLWWERRISKRKQGQVALYSDAAGKGQGYVIYGVKNNEFIIHEMFHLSEEARAALWTFIAQHNSMIDHVSLDAPIDDRLPDMLPEPSIKQEIIPYCMARIVDMQAFIHNFTFQESFYSDSFILEVKDEHASWNDGTYELTIEPSGIGRLLQVNDINEEISIIRAGIGALTSFFISYRTCKQLSHSNHI